MSLTMFVLFMLLCANEWLHVPIIVFWIAIFMLVNLSKTFRFEMTCSGENAEFTEEGFRHVAAMMEVDQMRTFLARTIEIKLGASLSKERGQLQLLAERCFVDGMARVTYEELLCQLRSAPWLNFEKKIGAGSLVVVQGRWRATVQELASNGDEVIIIYDVVVRSTKDQSREPQSQETQTVKLEDVKARTKLPPVYSGLVPDVVQRQAQKVRMWTDMIRIRLVPAIKRVTDIVTWKSRAVATTITVASCVGSVVLFLFHEWYRLCGETGIKRAEIQIWIREQLPTRGNSTVPQLCGDPEGWDIWQHQFSYVSGFVVFIMDHGLSTVFLVGGCGCLLIEARWMLPIFAVVRICKRRLRMKRMAPKSWAFFHKST